MKSKPKTSKTSTIKPVSINWKLWLGMDKINKFQAIGLTIPIPPEQIKVKLRRNNFCAELQNIDQKYVEEYELRVQQFKANTSFSHFDDFTDKVIFREFVLWINTHTDWAIPAELMEFTKKLRAAHQSITKESDRKPRKWSDGEKIKIADRMRNGEKSKLIGEDFDLSGSRIRQIANEGEELKHKLEINQIQNTLPKKGRVKANTSFFPKPELLALTRY
jgi:hypothetical protein